MALCLEGYVELPEHRGDGGFDHATVHHGLRRMYVAHTANDALDVIEIDRFELVDQVVNEPGAHTIGLDAERHRVYGLLPKTHRAAVFANDG